MSCTGSSIVDVPVPENAARPAGRTAHSPLVTAAAAPDVSTYAVHR
jgi:hypothetical protein